MEKDKTNLYPNTDFKSEGGGDYGSMKGRGYDPIQIVRDDVFGDREKGCHPGFDNLQIREIPKFLFDKFSSAAEAGHLRRTYGHYIKELKGAKALDSNVIQAFEKFTPEVERAITVKEQKKLFQEMQDYLGKLQMKKI